MPQDYMRIKKGIQRLFGIGNVEVAVDRVTGQRAIVVQTPAGRYPVPIDADDYLALGIAIVRDSGTVHDFSEPEPPPDPIRHRSEIEMMPDLGIPAMDAVLGVTDPRPEEG